MTRSDAREQALLALYAAEQRREPPDVTGLGEWARALVGDVWEHRAELDAAIGAASTRWRVERMPAVDRIVLRIALHELRTRPRTPVAVVISEAVALAGRYSTERSGRFVNGVLAALAALERPDE